MTWRPGNTAGMATIRRTPAGTWEVQIRRRGHRPVTRTFRTRAMAERWARQVEDEIASGEWTDRAAARTTTLGTLLERYEREFSGRKRSSSERGRLRLLARELGHLAMADVTPRVIVEYAQQRLAAPSRRTGRPVSQQTVVHELNTLSVVCRAALALWGIDLPRGNPVPVAREMLRPTGALRIAGQRRRRPTEDELDALRRGRQVGARWAAGLPPLVALAMDYSIETCMRRGELVAQRREHRRGTVLDIPDTKTGHPRTIPLSGRAQAILDELPARMDGLAWGLRADTITQAWSRACQRLGIADLRWHDLRHEGTSRLFEGRTFGRVLSVAEAAMVTGHRDVRQLIGTYTQLRPEDVARSAGGVKKQ